MASNAWEGVKELAGGAATMGKDILFPEETTEADKLKWLAHKYTLDPSDVEMRKAQTAKTGWESVGHSVAGAIPLVGPWAASLGEQAGKTDIGGAVSRAGAQVGAGELAHEVVKVTPAMAKAAIEKAGSGGTNLAQKYFNVGPELTERAVETWKGKAADVEAKYQDKLETAQQANETARQLATQKQQLIDEAAGHAKELAEHLPVLKEHEQAFAKSLYPEVDGTVSGPEIQGKLQDAIDSNLRGTNKPPAALARIVKELEPENPHPFLGNLLGEIWIIETEGSQKTKGISRLFLGVPPKFAAYGLQKCHPSNSEDKFIAQWGDLALAFNIRCVGFDLFTVRRFIQLSFSGPSWRSGSFLGAKL